MSLFTPLTPKDLQRFFGLDTYEKARKMAVLIRDTYDTKLLTVNHLAKYLGVPPAEVVIGLK